MKLDEALAQIGEIRAQLVRTESFRGYRALTVAITAASALTAGVLQAVYVSRPEEQPAAYVLLWVGTAAINLLLVSAELAWRCYRAGSPWRTRMTLLAAEQFLPCVLAAAVVTTVLFLTAPDALWLLPGIWSILFGLGVFASSRILPRPIFWAGMFYLAAGGLCLASGSTPWRLSPWLMSGTFGTGQLLTAAILYWTLEHGEVE